MLDMIGVNNRLHLGMIKLEDGRKTPHAWLTCEGHLLTPGIKPASGVILAVF
jgi:hypothetical protein